MVTLISAQVLLFSCVFAEDGATYWTYIPDLQLFQVSPWDASKPKVVTKNTAFMGGLKFLHFT